MDNQPSPDFSRLESFCALLPPYARVCSHPEIITKPLLNKDIINTKSSISTIDGLFRGALESGTPLNCTPTQYEVQQSIDLHFPTWGDLCLARENL